MSELFNSLSILILLSSFILMANKRVKSYIKTFRFQSFLIAFAAGIIGVKSILEEGRFDVLLVCLVIIILKVIYIPNLLNKMQLNVEYKVEKDFILNIPILIMGCCAIVMFTYFSLSGTDIVSRGAINNQIVNSISLTLIGLFFMISRKKAIGQIIGFLEIENGLFITALYMTGGMPLIVDLGTFIDLLTAVMIMGVMVFRINEKFESINIDKLNNLKG
ncbi:MAG: hydrogenase [Clostridiales bacterium]|nr:hydrogenase [Clostridiales bacterium]